MALFSIIVCTYNSEKTIERCLQSIFEQDFDDYEVILQDGKSSDQTLAVATRFVHLGAKIVSAPDLGIYDAFNKAVARCAGEYIIFLNSDDLFNSKDVLSALSKPLIASKPGAVHGNLLMVNAEGHLVRRWISRNFKTSRITLGILPPHPACVLKRRNMNAVGDFNTNYFISGDTDFLIRYFMKFPSDTVYIDKIVTKMYLGGASTGGIKSEYIKFKEDRNIFGKHFYFATLRVIFKKFYKLMNFL
jgi:glycosyltransferase involved in cell wall biosynthesis